MSRIGKKPIQLPQGVEVTRTSPTVVTVKGPKGAVECLISTDVEFAVEDNQVAFSLAKSCNPNNPQTKTNYGTARSLVQGAIVGVTDTWQKSLELHGVGYNAKLSGKELTLNVGYSHEVKFTVPDEINCKIEKNTKILLDSINKQSVGNFAAKIRKSCPPEPYLGKGIRYSDEHVKRKAGKAAAK